MIVPNKRLAMAVGKVTSNDGSLVVITMLSAETMRIHRWHTETEDHFKAEWPVGREVKIEVRR
jgi:hypothetical protein